MCKSIRDEYYLLVYFGIFMNRKRNQFSFTGQNDIAAFCRLAQKHGMYVMVRPSPYVCAEWEMGGLSWWLLKKKTLLLAYARPLLYGARGNLYEKGG